MAFFLNSTRFVKSQKQDGTWESREVKEFYVDTPADVSNLPGKEKVKECSTALCPSTSQVWVLMTNGWELMA